MKFNAITKALLHENPKALQFLHHVSGLDFTQPFYTIQGKGRFTYNQIEKQISTYTRESLNIAMFIRSKNDYFLKLYYVPIVLAHFAPVLPRGIPLWDYNLTDFNTKRDFEEVRKGETDHYYVVFQAKQYCKPWKEKPFDYNARYEVLKTYPGSINGTYYNYSLDVIDKGTMPRYISIIPKKFLYPCELEAAGTNIHNYIDKSGYWVSHFRHELHERLRDYKKNNARQLVLQYDFTATLHDLDSKTKEVKQALVAASDAMQTYEDCKKVERTAYNLGCMIYDANSIRRRIDEKEYWSLDSVQCDLEYFTTHYKSALKILGKGV
mgnify:CR=1 FL=1